LLVRGGSSEAAGWGGVTALQWGSHAASRYAVGSNVAHLIPFLRTVAQTHARAFVRVGFSFQAGVLVGSLVGGIPVEDHGTVGEFVGGALFDQYYWDRPFTPVRNTR
jgi:hypothetical protein